MNRSNRGGGDDDSTGPFGLGGDDLFMGGAGTFSKLHVDPGGLDLLIAPLVGCKEVTLVHRDDAELVSLV